MQRIQRTISEFMQPVVSIPSLSTDAPVSEAVTLMRTQSSDGVLVLEHGKLVGIFTERDFLNRVGAMRLDPGAIPMRDVMTPEPETLRPRDCISYAINRMAVRGFRNIPIVDEDDRVLSVLSVRTVMDHMTEVFADIEDAGPDSEWQEWTDIGGGA